MTTSVTDDRERFEAWAIDEDFNLSTDINGNYIDHETARAMRVFKAALRSQGKVEGWRPIETAPEGVPCIVGWIDDGDECTEFDTLEEGIWQMHYGGWEHFISVAPPGSRGPSEKAPYTHWMPLPPVPTNGLTAIIGEVD